MPAEGAKILYFGYGANREPRMMHAITRNPNLVGHSIVLKGFKLCVQKLDQIPDNVPPDSPAPKSARQILKDAGWPSTFQSYIVKPDPEGKVIGMLWELTPLERELVREWELVEYGWYRDYNLRVDLTKDGSGVFEVDENGRFPVQTEGLREDQEVDREVNGLAYESWLQPPEDFERVAEISAREYLERTGKTLEGQISNGKENKP